MVYEVKLLACEEKICCAGVFPHLHWVASTNDRAFDSGLRDDPVNSKLNDCDARLLSDRPYLLDGFQGASAIFLSIQTIGPKRLGEESVKNGSSFPLIS